MPFLEALLERAFPGHRLLQSRELSGGVSAQAIVCDLERPEGGTERVVVRRPGIAHGSQDAAHVAREFRVLGLARTAGVAAPKPRYLDEAHCALILDYVPGRPDFAPTNLTTSMQRMADELVAIHRVTASTNELSFLPPRDDAAARAIARRPETLDESLDEPRLREVLGRLWPWPQLNPSVLLHGDYWPGNVLWEDERISAVLDWEESFRGDPLADVALTRLDLLWAFGERAMDAFTRHYQSVTRLDWTHLPHWDLCIALRPMSNLERWAKAYPSPPISRPDIDEAAMRAGHRRFVRSALERLDLPP